MEEDEEKDREVEEEEEEEKEERRKRKRKRRRCRAASQEVPGGQEKPRAPERWPESSGEAWGSRLWARGKSDALSNVFSNQLRMHAAVPPKARSGVG